MTTITLTPELATYLAEAIRDAKDAATVRDIVFTAALRSGGMTQGTLAGLDGTTLTVNG